MLAERPAEAHGQGGFSCHVQALCESVVILHKFEDERKQAQRKKTPRRSEALGGSGRPSEPDGRARFRSTAAGPGPAPASVHHSGLDALQPVGEEDAGQAGAGQAGVLQFSRGLVLEPDAAGIRDTEILDLDSVLNRAARLGVERTVGLVGGQIHDPQASDLGIGAAVGVAGQEIGGQGREGRELPGGRDRVSNVLGTLISADAVRDLARPPSRPGPAVVSEDVGLTIQITGDQVGGLVGEHDYAAIARDRWNAAGTLVALENCAADADPLDRTAHLIPNEDVGLSFGIETGSS